ncbi:MAG: BMA_0021/BMA_0022 family TOMM bacteriocin [Pseudomonadota bacterium]
MPEPNEAPLRKPPRDIADYTGTARYDLFLEARVYIVRAVALAWKDEAFKRDFLKDPAKAMEEAFGYVWPYNVEFEAFASRERWQPELVQGWRGAINVIELPLPPAPPKDQRAEAIGVYGAEHLIFLTDHKGEKRNTLEDRGLSWFIDDQEEGDADGTR